MFRLMICCLTIVLIGCASPSITSITRLPGGKEGYEVTCPGATWEVCYKKAEALCPAEGYQVLNRYEDYSRRSIPRSMLITCNPPSSNESNEANEANESLEDSPATSLELSPQGNCCADLEKLTQECRHDVTESHLTMLSDPLEIALIKAVRSALPRSELEALVRMLSN